MGKDASKLEKDIESLRKRIQTSKRNLREAERKAEDLQSSIQTAMLAREKIRRNRKPSP
jgi:chaperonin cofactor prefoldin